MKTRGVDSPVTGERELHPGEPVRHRLRAIHAAVRGLQAPPLPIPWRMAALLIALGPEDISLRGL